MPRVDDAVPGNRVCRQHLVQSNSDVPLETYAAQVAAGMVRQIMDNNKKTGQLSSREQGSKRNENSGKKAPESLNHPRPGNDSPGHPGWKVETKSQGSSNFESTGAITVAIPSAANLPQKPAAQENTAPFQIIDDRYQICECLGQGAMGAVYEVKHLRLDKRFAMKVIHPKLAKNKKTIARFHREALALSRIDHPNCIGVTDFGETPNGNFYLVMQRVDGKSLKDILAKKGPLSVREAIEVTRQVLLGLGHAHRAGIIHRDIKLENIIKSENANGGFVAKIIDFGLAKEKMPKESLSAITEAGVVLGTPQYIAPETILSQAINQQTDLYAVAVTLFRMLTAKPVWFGDDVGEVLQAKMRNPTPRLNDAGAGTFPRVLEDFLAKAMDEPENRFANATEMRKALAQVAEGVSRSKSRMSHFAVSKLKPATAAARRYGQRATSSTFEHGKKIGAKIGSDFRAWWKTTPSGSGNPWMARVANLGKTSEGRQSLAIALMPILFAVVIVGIWAIGDIAFRSDGKNGGDDVSKGAAQVVAAPKYVSAEDFDDSQAEYALRVGQLLRRNKCDKAKSILTSELAEKPKSAHAHFLLGRAHMCLRNAPDGFVSYKEAIDLDDSYKSSKEVLADTKRLLDKPKVRLLALEFMTESLGESALPVLVDVAENHRNPKLRHGAMDYVEQAGALSQVKQEKSLALDLKQAKSCNEKAEIVDKLADLGTSAARKTLKRARNAVKAQYYGGKRYVHACVRERIKKHLSEMPQETSRV